MNDLEYQRGLLRALKRLEREGGQLFSRRDLELRAKYLIKNPKHRAAFVEVMTRWLPHLVRDACDRILGRKRWKDSKGRRVHTRIRLDLKKLFDAC